MNHYVYKITNHQNGMFYIGMRSCSKLPQDDLGIDYFSSSSNKMFISEQKENPQNFKYDILKTFKNPTDAKEFEKDQIIAAKKHDNCYNGGINFVKPLQPLSTPSTIIIKLLGQMIKSSRKESKMSETNLSERVGIARATLQKVEKGDASVSIGTYIEAAVILGIPLMGGNKENINNMTKLLGYMNTLLPDNIRGKRIEVDDDF